MPDRLKLKSIPRNTKLGLSGISSSIDSVVLRNSPGQNIATTVSNLNITTHAAGIDAIIQTATTDLLLTTNQANIIVGAIIPTTVAGLVLAENQATIFYDPVVQTTVHNLIVTTNSADISVGEPANSWFGSNWWKTPTFGTTWWPEGTGDTQFNTVVDNLTLTTYTADVQPNINYVIANTKALLLTEYQASIILSDEIAAVADNLVLTTNATSIIYDVNITTTVSNLLLAENAVVVNINTPIITTADDLSLTTYTSNVTLDKNIFATVKNLSIDTLSAIVAPTVMAIQFNRPFTFTDGKLGVEFIKDLGLGGETTVNPTEAIDWGSNVMEYTVSINAGIGETMHYRYTSATGDYLDANGQSMADIELQLINCKEA